jgi:hypothetical protein
MGQTDGTNNLAETINCYPVEYLHHQSKVNSIVARLCNIVDAADPILVSILLKSCKNTFASYLIYIAFLVSSIKSRIPISESTDLR